LNGAALKTEGRTELKELDKELENLVPGGSPMTFIIG